ncbi:MAG TPA: universal stress protein [Thermomicrobiales bacterium]|nr:universal stress protein [Thermomicrobiales bacterium]
MFDRILVALDGSQRSEATLPYAEALATAFDSGLVLVRALQFAPLTTGPVEPYIAPQVYQELYDTESQAAGAYLERVAAGLRERGRRVRTMVVPGHPAGAILDTAEAEGVGLIAMATHGRSGLARFALGSIAELVLRATRHPLLLVRTAGPARFTRVLLPLDGSPLAETVLPLARDLAAGLGLEVVLLRVAPNAAERTDARVYLEAAAADLRAGGLTVATRVTEGAAAEEILQVTAAEGISPIAMATRGRGGPARWVLGSVAESVVRASTVPVLVLRGTGEAAEPAAAEPAARADGSR